MTSGLILGPAFKMAESSSVSEGDFSSALAESLESFTHKSLKPEQKECIRRIVSLSEDVLAVLPTGFGKSAIFQMIPKVFGVLHRMKTGETKEIIVAVVCPLEYIRKQQVESVRKADCGLSATTIGESEETDLEIEDGKYNIAYGSAEQWLSERWKKALQFGALHMTKVLVVDEVHTVETW